MNSKNILGTKPVNSLLFQFATPSVIAMLVSALYNIVDQLFIGNSVGYLGNAATNVAFPLVIGCISLALLVGIGCASNFNLNMGRRKEEEAKKYITHAFVLMVIFGIILTILVKIFLTPMLVFFGATDEILEYARIYTGITSYSLVFLIIINASNAIIRADGSPRYAMMTIIVGCIINLILDPLFIFVFDMGIAGAAWATFLAQSFSGLMVLLYMRHFKTVEVNFKDTKYQFKYFKDIILLGLAPFTTQLTILLVQILINNSLKYYAPNSPFSAEVALAVIGIGMKVNLIFFAFAIGIGQGLQPIASYNYGAKLYSRVKKAYKTSVIAALSILSLSFLLFQFFPDQIIRVFGDGSKEYYEFGRLFFKIYLFFIPLNAIQPITSNLLSSIGKAKKGVFLALTRQFFFFIPFAIVLPMFFGIYGIIYTGPIADFLAFIVAVILAKREFKEQEELMAVEIKKA